MDKSLLISNNTYDKIDTIGLNFTHDSGNAYSIDRVYGIINDTIDCQLRAKSRFLGSFVYYFLPCLYQSDGKNPNDTSYGRIFDSCILKWLSPGI